MVMVPKTNSSNVLPDDVDALKALVLAERVENDRLRAIIKEFPQFGCSSEKIDPGQLRLALGQIEPADAKDEADEEKNGATLKASRKKDRHVNRGALPKHLPRIENVIEPTSTQCPCCGGAMHVIGEDKSERLDVIPAQFRVIVTKRPKYGCRACESAVIQAPAPPWLIEGGLPTEQLIAHVIVGRYADHLPLYRQAQIYARQGIDLDRSTLADWIGRAAFELRPIYERLIELLKRSAKLFMDETRAPVLEPGLGRTKGGFFWAMARDDRPWGGKDPPAVIYRYAPGRGGDHALAHLAGFTGTLQVDEPTTSSAIRTARAAPLRSRSAGRMSDAPTTRSRKVATRRSPRKPFSESNGSTGSRRIFVAALRMNGAPSGKPELDRSSMHFTSGFRINWSGCRQDRRSPKRSATPSITGTVSCSISTTAGSKSTPTRSSVRSGLWLYRERTHSSATETPAVSAGQSSPR